MEGVGMSDPVTVALISYVLGPFVSKVTENFLGRQRNTVSVAELQDQVSRLLESQRELNVENAKTRVAVLFFARHLARTHGETFALTDDRLELVAKDTGRREEIVEHALGGFSSSVEARLMERAGKSPGAAHVRPVSPPTSSRPPHPETSTATVGTATSEALNRFFEGFDKEIMDARLGRGERDGADRRT